MLYEGSSMYQPVPLIQQHVQIQQDTGYGTANLALQHQPFLHQHTHTHHLHQHQHQHVRSHSQQPQSYNFQPGMRHSMYHSEIAPQHSHLNVEQPLSVITNRNLINDPGIVACGPPSHSPANISATGSVGGLHTEIVVVEKIKRNAVKTQATQTEVKKDNFHHALALSPRVAKKVNSLEG